MAGLPAREDRVLLAASTPLAEVLAPEWRQTLVDAVAPPSDEVLAEADLVLVEWTGGPGTAHPVSVDTVRVLVERATALGVPVLVWDTVHRTELPGVDLPSHVVVRVVDPARRERYADRQTEVLGPTYQQRRHRPGAARWARHPVWVHHRDGDPIPSAELLRAAASGAVVVTDRAEVADAVPGVLVAAGAQEAEWTEAALRAHGELRVRQSATSARAALTGWSAAVRADAILQAIGRPGREAATVSAIVPTMRPDQLDNVLDFVARQTHPRVQLVLVTHGFDIPEVDLFRRAGERGLTDVVAVPADGSITLGECMNLGVAAAGGQYVAKMDDDNVYGRHYLADLVAAFEYTDAQVVGKWAHLVHLRSTGATLLRFPGFEHTYCPQVQGGTMVMAREVAVEIGFEELPRRVDTTFLEKVAAAGGRTYSTDRFGFVSVRGVDAGDHTWQISDLELLAKPSRLLFYGDPSAYADV